MNGLRFVQLFFLSLLPFLISPVLSARTITVGSSGDYTRLSAAALVAVPGDTIAILSGTHDGGEWIEDLHGSEGKDIVIRGAGPDVVYMGGTEAWHLSDVSWIRIEGIEFTGQTGNGLNIDDGGTFDTPSHHVTIENCYFHDMNASGNNDLLKLSGLDRFVIRNCRFADGADGGSGTDMVGCHDGLFTGNRYERMGSNAIQAKGGTQRILIDRNFFRDCGERTLNLGGSTGLQFFRPVDAPFEGADLQVTANVIIGSRAPFAIVGAVRVDITNNTVYLPGRWVLRLLQETVDPERFVEAGESIIRNNIFVYDANLATAINIGPNTRPQTLLFSNNLWYNRSNPTSGSPDLPVAETGQIVNSDPQFVSPSNDNFHIAPTSPARGMGMEVDYPVLDFQGEPYLTPRSVGAFEIVQASVVPDQSGNDPTSLTMRWINQGRGHLIVESNSSESMDGSLQVFDLLGRMVMTGQSITIQPGGARLNIALPPENAVLFFVLRLGDVVRILQVNSSPQ